VTKLRVRFYLFVLLLLAGAGAYYFGAGGGPDFPFLDRGKGHHLVLNGGWKLTSPLAQADISIEWAVGGKHHLETIHVTNQDVKVYNHYEDDYHDEFAWITVVSSSAKVVSCGINRDGDWVVTPQLDVETDATGRVVAVWYRCQMLPFKQRTVSDERAIHMDEAGAVPVQITGVEVLDQ
jgi:hypothetical protein